MSYYKLKYDLGAPTFFNFVDFSEVTMKRQIVENEVYDRFILDGNFTFFGDDFDIIYNARNQSRIPVELYKNNNLQVNGWLILNGKDVEFDVSYKKASLSFETNDQYTELIKNIDVESNIADITDIKKVKSSYADSKLEFNNVAFTENSGLGSIFYQNLPLFTIYARESITNLTTTQVNQFINRLGWQLKDGTTNTIIRDWTYAFDTPIPKDFWVFYSLGEAFSVNEQYPNNNVFLSDFTLLDNINPGPDNWLALNNKLYYSDNNIVYSQTRKLTDIIELCLNTADANLTFNYNNAPILTELLIGITSDMQLINELPPSNYTKVSKLSVKELLDYLKTEFYIYYKISNTKEVTFYYKPDLYSLAVSSLPEHESTNFKGINWTEYKNKFVLVNSEKFRTHKRVKQAIYNDFVGVDAIHYNINNNSLKEIVNTKFIHDIQGFEDEPDKFNISSSNFITLQCDEITENILLFFQNAWTQSVEKINGIGTYTGGEIFLIDNLNLIESDDGTGALLSNEFAGNYGDTINFSINLPGNTGLKWQVVRDYSVNESFEDTWVGVSSLVQINTSGVYNGSFILNQKSDTLRILLYLDTNVENIAIELSNISTTINNYYELRQGTGVLSNISIKNAGISLANLDNTIYADSSDKDVLLNNVSVELDLSKVIFSDKILPFEMPINNLANSFNFDEYFKHNDYANCRIESLNMKCDLSDICEININK